MLCGAAAAVHAPHEHRLLHHRWCCALLWRDCRSGGAKGVLRDGRRVRVLLTTTLTTLTTTLTTHSQHTHHMLTQPILTSDFVRDTLFLSGAG